MDFPPTFTKTLIDENNKMHLDLIKIRRLAENLVSLPEGLVNAQGLGKYILNQLDGIENPPYIHMEFNDKSKKWWKK